MTWTKLLANKDAQKHKTSKKELDNMRALIARDLADASLAGLSADRRFATAYNAALHAANMAIACAGYRIVSKVGHHRVSLESTKLVLGKAAHKYADYFETCRRKRSTIDYTFSNVANDTEAKEIVVQAKQFYVEVEDWITKNNPAEVPSHPARCRDTGRSVPSECSPSRGESCIAVASPAPAETDRSARTCRQS